MALNIMQSLKSIADQRRSVAKLEQNVITALKRVLPGFGYQLVPSGDGNSAPPTMAPRRGRKLSSSRRSLACPHCERRFAHPLHLGRHVSATHKNVKAQSTTSASASQSSSVAAGAPQKDTPATMKPRMRRRRVKAKRRGAKSAGKRLR
jgi:hypothetical protein